MAKRVLVTGGAGYTGSHCALALKAAGFSPVLFDDLSTGNRAVAGILDVPLIQGSVLKPNDLKAAFFERKFDAVVHCAGATLIGESVKNPMKYWEVNLLGGLNLLNAMAFAGVKHIVFNSTADVYGEPEKTPISETARAFPVNPYGATKLAFELALENWRQVRGITYASLRSFNAAGADEEGRLGEWHAEESHLIPLIFETIDGKRDRIVINGDNHNTKDGTPVRDYIHAQDAGEAHALAVKALSEGAESFTANVGSGEGHSVREVIAACEEVTGVEIPVEVGSARPGDPGCLVARITNLKKHLNFQPLRSDLRFIVETAWNWHKTHPKGYG